MLRMPFVEEPLDIGHGITKILFVVARGKAHGDDLVGDVYL